MDELFDTLDAAGQRLGPVVAGVFEAAGLRGVSDDDLLAVLRVASALSRHVDALLVEATGEAAARSASLDRAERLTTRVQCRNVTELVSRTTRVSARRAAEWERAASQVRHTTAVTTGELLPPQFPALREALGDGQISTDGVWAATGPLQDAAGRIDPDARRIADEQLAAMARGEGPDGAPAAGADELKTYAQVLAVYLDPDGAEPRAERAMAKRGITLGNGRDGLVTLNGRLLPEVAAQFQRIVDSITNPRVPQFFPTSGTAPDGDTAADDQTGTAGADATPARPFDLPPVAEDARGDDQTSSPAARPDAEPTADWCGGRPDASEVTVPMDMSAPAWGPVDPRSPAQKRHDALATALIAAAGSGQLPTLGGDAPTLVIIARQEDLDQNSGAGHVTEHDEPVSLAAARQAACTGRVRRVAIDANGRITELLSLERCFTSKQRQAIAARDGGCIIPGCTVPANWCEVHHVIEWADDGLTHPDNGCLLCWFHHRTLDQTGWQIRMTDGVPEVQAPDWWDPSRSWRKATKSQARIRNILDDQRYPWADNPDWTPSPGWNTQRAPIRPAPTRRAPTRPALTINTISPTKPNPAPGVAWTAAPGMNERPERPDARGFGPTADDDEFRPWGQAAEAVAPKPAAVKRPPWTPPISPRPWGQPADQPERENVMQREPEPPADVRPWGQPADPTDQPVASSTGRSAEPDCVGEPGTDDWTVPGQWEPTGPDILECRARKGRELWTDPGAIDLVAHVLEHVSQRSDVTAETLRSPTRLRARQPARGRTARVS